MVAARSLLALCCALLLALILSPRGAASAAKSRRKKRSAARQQRAPVPEPPPVSHVEELDADGFEAKVRLVANGTEAGTPPPYYPLVMFHVSWCEHCRRALPEFEQAAERVARMVESGQLSHFPVPPKFFSFICGDETQDLCQYHSGSTFPHLIVFRDARAIVFNRPRIASTITWWSMRVTRPAIMELATYRQLDSYWRETIFILKANSKRHAALVRDWRHIALNYIDEYTFVVVQPGTGLASERPAPLGVELRAPRELGLEPLPLQAAMGRQTLEAWVNFNQFPPCVDLSPWTVHDVQRSGLVVVALVHGAGEEGLRARRDFEARVRELRPRGRYLFGAVNASDIDAADLLRQEYVLLAPAVSGLPRIFCFSGRGLYWEDPELLTPADITLDSIEDLLLSAEARHDGTVASWLKERRKIIVRFGSRSWGSLVLAVSLPVAVAAFFLSCVRALLAPDPEEPPSADVAEPSTPEEAAKQARVAASRVEAARRLRAHFAKPKAAVKSGAPLSSVLFAGLPETDARGAEARATLAKPEAAVKSKPAKAKLGKAKAKTTKNGTAKTEHLD